MAQRQQDARLDRTDRRFNHPLVGRPPGPGRPAFGDDDYEYIEPIDASFWLDGWVRPDGTLAAYGDLPLLPGELMPAGRLDPGRPDPQRLREKSRGAAAHYDIDVIADDSGEKARAVTWERRPLAGTMITHPGVYCLRTNVQDWDEETLWRTYTSLTDVEAVFRSLKSELGLRPIFHRTQGRSDGHLFITVIAYQMVQTIRRRLGEKGERESWASLRAILEGQQRVTATFRRKDGRTLHVRKATRAEPEQQKIFRALGTDPAPGGIRKMIV